MTLPQKPAPYHPPQYQMARPLDVLPRRLTVIHSLIDCHSFHSELHLEKHQFSGVTMYCYVQIQIILVMVWDRVPNTRKCY